MQTKLKNLILYLGAVGVGVFFLIFLTTCTIIGSGVKEKCRLAQEKYSGDCVEALMVFLEDENNAFRERNSAIWALGQLGDKRALPVLEKYYTGEISDKEPLDQGLSQYELKKAIKLTEGGINLSAFAWR